MDNFATGFLHIIAAEGTIYTNRKEDLGGPTKYGITQKTLSSWRSQAVTAKDVENLKMESAKIIYRAMYWDEMNLDGLPFFIQLALFDQGVNKGPQKAVKIMQKVLNLKEDGILGPVTKATILGRDPEALAWNYLKESLRDYVSIAQRNPSQLANLMGWTNRILNLTDVFV